jgi:HK97 family phage portal protein
MNLIEKAVSLLPFRNLVPDPTSNQVMMAMQAGARQDSWFKNMLSKAFSSYISGDWKMDDYITKGYGGNTAVYTCVNMITNNCSLPTFKVYDVRDVKKHLQIKAWTGASATAESIVRAQMLKEMVYSENTVHPMNILLDKPNRYQTQAEFIQTCAGFKLITGNRFMFVNKLNAGANEGKPTELYNLPPQHMTIIADRHMFSVLEYQFLVNEQRFIPAEYILHSRYPNYEFDQYGSHLWGMSPLRAGRRTVTLSSGAEDRSVILMDTGGASGLIYKRDAKIEPDPVKKAQIRQELNETINGRDSAGTIAMANGDMGYIKFGMTAADLSLIELEKFANEKIAGLYRIPPGLLQASANATDNNIAAWNKQVITRAVIPELNSIREDLNMVAKMYGDNIYIDYDLSVFPELQEDMAAIATRLANMPYYTYNEKRVMTGGDKDPDNKLMDKYYVTSNTIPLEMAGTEQIRSELDKFDPDEEK